LGVLPPRWRLGPRRPLLPFRTPHQVFLPPPSFFPLMDGPGKNSPGSLRRRRFDSSCLLGQLWCRSAALFALPYHHSPFTPPTTPPSSRWTISSWVVLVLPNLVTRLLNPSLVSFPPSDWPRFFSLHPRYPRDHSARSAFLPIRFVGCTASPQVRWMEFWTLLSLTVPPPSSRSLGPPKFFLQSPPLLAARFRDS